MDLRLTISALAALAQETRLTIFRLLVEHGPKGLPAGSIAARLRLANATLSFHLKELNRAGLVQAKPQGRSIIYSADFQTMNALISFLTENCCRASGAACKLDGAAMTRPASRSGQTKRRQR